jgi:chromosome segregation protein
MIGFKSFADKTHLQFHQGITAIVGPNGCGKSNILDAIRWCLGEQSPKALRGNAMPDVIFSGTDSRPPLSMAEVSLTFSDCDATLHTSFREVCITRRLFRDGSSQYEINRTPCRLRDIHQLFMDTGIGRSAYSIMEQGKITLLIQAKPEERRAVFEEAAGITKYKTQRREALRKLEATQQNLEHLNIIIDEVKRQIASLQRQASKARRYQHHYSQLKNLDLKLARRLYQQLCTTITTLETNLNHSRQEYDALHQQAIEEEFQLSTLRRKLQETTETLQNHAHAHATALTQAEQAAQREQLSTQRRAEAQSWKERTAAEIASIEEKIHTQQSLINSLTAQENTIQHDLSAAQSEMHHRSQILTQSQAKLRALQDQKLSLSTQIQQLNQQIELHRANLSRLETLHQTTLIQLDSLRQEQQQLELQFQEIDLHIRTHEDQLNTATQKLQEAENSLSSAQNQERHRLESLNTIENKFRTLAQDLKNKEGQLAAFQKLEDNHAETSPIAQEILKAHHQGLLTTQILGTLSDHIHVQPGSEKPIATLLGQALHALLVHDPQAIETLWKHFSLSEKTHLVLAPTTSNHTNSPTPAAPNHLSTYPETAALRLIQADAQAIHITHRLLKDAHIARDLPHAREIKHQYPEATIVLQDGSAIIHQAGLCIIGSDQGQAALTVLIRRNEIRRLQNEIQTDRNNLSEIETALINARTLHLQAQHHLEEARNTLQEARIAYATAKSAYDNAQTSIQKLSLRKQDCLREITQLTTHEECHQDNKNTLEKTLSEATCHLATLQESLQKIDKQILSAINTEALARDALASAQLNLRSLEQLHHNHHQQILAARHRLEELQANLATRHEEIAAYQITIQEAEEAIHAAQQAQNQAQETAATALSLKESTAQLLQSIQTQIAQHESKLLEHRTRLESWQSTRTQKEITLAESRVHLRNHLDKIFSQYQVAVEDLPPISQEELQTTNWQEIQNQAEELRQKIQSLGPVNLDSITEFQELEDRFAFLTNQQQDLTRSKEQLLQAIAQINLTSKKLFTDTFEKIRANFNTLFQDLFGGGKAELQLLENQDPLESGIDIIARPPGKKPQSITLLSGGEQTLTAIALLFAIYKVKPSPFCVLDEMDAPLDESNIDRFISLLKQFTEHSQFMVITHNKRTIQSADVVYGVTMQDRGISRIISLLLSDSPLISQRKTSPHQTTTKATDRTQNTEASVPP